MNVLIVCNGKLPALKYGGVERVIWYLGSELATLGHKVSYLVPRGSWCPFADVIDINPSLPLVQQIPDSTDIVHYHFQPPEVPAKPHLVTIHGNMPPDTSFFRNTNFVSKNHAFRYGATAFVYNGLNWANYAEPEFGGKKEYVHFLGKAAWRVKNVKGAIALAHRNRTEIKVLGGTRINLKMGLRITLSPYATFYGMVDDKTKNELLRHSRGLIFPVLWHEPFGLAIIESLYYGCPVLGSTYGALPELVPSGCGYLSDSAEELDRAFENLSTFNRRLCSDYAREQFGSAKMAGQYLALYEKIMNGNSINEEVPAFVAAANKL